MRRLILGLMDSEPSGTIEQARHGDRFAITAEHVATFDEKDVIEGTAMGSVQFEREEPEIAVPADRDKRDDGEFSILTERVERGKKVATDYVADLDAGIIAVDSSDGTFLWDWLAPDLDVLIARAEINVDAIAERVERDDSLTVWQSGWNVPDPDIDDVGVAYHEAAEVRTHGCTQLGFEGVWGDFGYLRGTMSASGYVALFQNLPGPELAEWLRSEILPHASVPEEEGFQWEIQDAMAEAAADGGVEADE